MGAAKEKAQEPIPDFDHPPAKILSPSVLAHVVLRSNDMARMVDFYITFLGGKLVHANAFISFVTYDEEHHRIAILQVPGTQPKIPTTCGLEHIAFTFPSLTDLLMSYRQRKKLGIEPIWCVNHGPTTSMYYKDPDGNMLETQADNFDTSEEMTEFMMGAEFAHNSVGTDYDPEELIARLKAGEDEKMVKKRIEVGPRGLPNIDAM